MNQPFKYGCPRAKIPTNLFSDDTILLAEGIIQRNFPDIPSSLSTPLIAAKLFLAILSENYFLEWDSVKGINLYKSIGYPLTLHIVEGHINAFAESGFIDKSLWESSKIITSQNIQKIWMREMKTRRRSGTIRPEHNLLNAEPATL